jgi:hypothetical protein
MSGANVTWVTVTGPTRGSLTSRDNKVASTRCICDSMRWVRLLLVPFPAMP